MAGIFISYRREDGGPYAGRLYDALVNHLDRDTVFFDIDSIGPGEDFREVLQRTLSSCKVVLAIIGTRWSTVQDKAGRTRIANDHDYVRMEISYALKNGLKVIPVLVGGASLPAEADLPSDLRDLRYRNAWDLSDRRFHQDVQILVDVIRKALGTPVPPTPAPAAHLPTPAAQKPPVQIEPIAGSSLFPLYGITLGETTLRELAKIGKRASLINSSTGKPHHYYVVNEIQIWYSDFTKTADAIYLMGEDKVPPEWIQIGFKRENSYNQWLSWLEKMNYSVEVETQPNIEQSKGQHTFSAKVNGRMKDSPTHQITLVFQSINGSIDSPSTLLSADITFEEFDD